MNSLLFPSPMREFPGARWVRITLRTLHLLSMGFLLGGVAQGLAPMSLPYAFWGTLISGGLFVLLELYQSCLFLLQLKGIAVMVKMALFFMMGHQPDWAVPLMVTAVIIGGVSSHMQGKYRYFSPWHGKVMKE